MMPTLRRAAQSWGQIAKLLSNLFISGGIWASQACSLVDGISELMRDINV